MYGAASGTRLGFTEDDVKLFCPSISNEAGILQLVELPEDMAGSRSVVRERILGGLIALARYAQKNMSPLGKYRAWICTQAF